MKKGFAFLAIVFVVTVIVYRSVDWGILKQNANQAFVELVNGERFELNTKEANLPVHSGERKVVISDLGMVCTSCRETVIALLKEIEGVTVFYVNLELDRITVVYDPDTVSLDQIKQKIIDKGGKIGEVKEIQS
jgi:copper chaperone CopZ